MYSIIVLLLLIFGASSWLVYHWQHQKVENLTSSLRASNKKADASGIALNNEVKSNSDLQKKYQDTLNKLNAATTAKTTPAHTPTQEDLDLTVDKAVTTALDVSSTSLNVIAINITLTNSTDSTIAVLPTAYSVKDASGHVYSWMFSSATGFGKDFVPLRVNELAPGQTATGYIGIQITDANITDYTLILGSHTYKVTATKLASYPVSD